MWRGRGIAVLCPETIAYGASNGTIQRRNLERAVLCGTSTCFRTRDSDGLTCEIRWHDRDSCPAGLLLGWGDCALNPRHGTCRPRGPSSPRASDVEAGQPSHTLRTGYSQGYWDGRHRTRHAVMHPRARRRSAHCKTRTKPGFPVGLLAAGHLGQGHRHRGWCRANGARASARSGRPLASA